LEKCWQHWVGSDRCSQSILPCSVVKTWVVVHFSRKCLRMSNEVYCSRQCNWYKARASCCSSDARLVNAGVSMPVALRLAAGCTTLPVSLAISLQGTAKGEGFVSRVTKVVGSVTLRPMSGGTVCCSAMVFSPLAALRGLLIHQVNFMQSWICSLVCP
jgi:hypothetical protein